MSVELNSIFISFSILFVFIIFSKFFIYNIFRIVNKNNKYYTNSRGFEAITSGVSDFLNCIKKFIYIFIILIVFISYFKFKVIVDLDKLAIFIGAIELTEFANGIKPIDLK